MLSLKNAPVDPLEPYDHIDDFYSRSDDPDEPFPEGCHPGVCGLWKNPYFKKPVDKSAVSEAFDDGVHEQVRGHFHEFVEKVERASVSSSASSSSAPSASTSATSSEASSVDNSRRNSSATEKHE